MYLIGDINSNTIFKQVSTDPAVKKASKEIDTTPIEDHVTRLEPVEQEQENKKDIQTYSILSTHSNIRVCHIYTLHLPLQL